MDYHSDAASEYSDADFEDSSDTESHGAPRLQMYSADSLDEEWYTFDAQYTDTFSCLALVNRQRIHVKQLDKVQRLKLLGTATRQVAHAFVNLQALVLEPGDDCPGSPWCFDLSGLAQLGSQLQHLELDLPSFQDDYGEIEKALTPLVGLRHLRVSGQRHSSFGQLRVIERMGLLEYFHFDAYGSFHYNDHLGITYEPILDVSLLRHLRTLSLVLPDLRLCSPEEAGAWIGLKFSRHLTEVRAQSGEGLQWPGFSEKLKEELAASGINAQPQRWEKKADAHCSWNHLVLRGPWQAAYGAYSHARNAHACLQWASFACERLTGAQLPDLCLDLVERASRLVVGPSGEDDAVVAWREKRSETLERHARIWVTANQAEQSARLEAKRRADEEAKLLSEQLCRREQERERELEAKREAKREERAAEKAKRWAEKAKAKAERKVAAKERQRERASLRAHALDGSDATTGKRQKSATTSRLCAGGCITRAPAALCQHRCCAKCCPGPCERHSLTHSR
mmetsp:Transcript_38876/g.64514  ORF Transcript_38876/g.64514 Transcript_38876/m.64514 type:complete len:511 (-) Transcript_38876:643-2175(-)